MGRLNGFLSLSEQSHVYAVRIADHPILLVYLMLIYRYLTKICDQVVALLSAEHTASIVWGDEDEDDESIDVDAGDDDRLFTYEVAKRNEQEESASSRPGFQVITAALSSNANSTTDFN